jgi:uncharacterized membrane protein YcaP (DUF421 family)
MRWVVVPDWKAIFEPSTALGEVMIRATLMYLFLFFAVRFLLKREGGAVNIADLLVIVAIVDGVGPAFSGSAQSVTEGAVFVLTVIFWSWFLNWLSFRFPALTFLTSAPPEILVKDGRMRRRAMARALMTKEELYQQLREQGVEKVEDVRLAVLEGDGEVSVVARD